MNRVLVGVVLATGLLAGASRADANSCNLWAAQRFGELREGCAMTVFSLPEIRADLPTVERNGQELTPVITQDTITLKVTFEHYTSPDSCDTYYEYENKTFDRYVITWPDLKGGEQVILDNYPYPVTVPGPGDCGPVEPFFYCQDGIQFCDDFDPDPDSPNDDGDDDDGVGCSVGSGSASWLSLLGVLGLVRSISGTRRARSSRRR